MFFLKTRFWFATHSINLFEVCLLFVLFLVMHNIFTMFINTAFLVEIPLKKIFLNVYFKNICILFVLCMIKFRLFRILVIIIPFLLHIFLLDIVKRCGF